VKVVRSLLGVLVGCGLFFALARFLPGLTGAAPGNDLLFEATGTVVAAVLAGYAAAFIGGAHEFPHAAAVGLFMVGMGFVSMMQAGAKQPGWHEMAVAGCGPISALIGAAIRLLTKSRRTG
jgi:hypothetical protein